eukprot:g9186.t1
MPDLSGIINVAKQQAKAENRPRRTESKWNLSLIQDRAEDTRELNNKHVNALCESISALGLIEPLVIDQEGVLLAGGHRKAAIAHLKIENSQQYQKHFPEDMVPVRIMDFNSKTDPERALEIEIAENEQRRDYSIAEVKAIAERLRKAGYTESSGRPKKGEKALKPALSVVIGKSIRQVKRYLATETENPASDTVSPETYIKRAIQNLEKWEKRRGRKQKELEIAKKLPEIMEVLRKGLE